MADTAPDGLNEELQQAIRDAYAALSTRLPGFRPRKSQRRMIAEIGKTVGGSYPSPILVVEGPTGVGKSLAYLLGALPVARAREKNLVISTATVALQEQLIEKDLPLLQAHTDLKFSYTMAKGRGRYVCDKTLDALAATADADKAATDEQAGSGDAGDGAWTFRPSRSDLETVARMAENRSNHEWNGDYDGWPDHVRQELRTQLGSTVASCTKTLCPFYDRCAYYEAKTRRRGMDVIVANHALVVADVFMGGNVVLPAPADTIYVFDEGHHLPAVALDQAKSSTTLKGAQSWIDNIDRLMRDVPQIMPLKKYSHDLTRIQDALADDKPRLIEALDDLHRFVRSEFPAETAEANEPWRFKLGRIDNADLASLFQRAGTQAAEVLAQLTRLKEVIDACQKAGDVTDENASPLRSAVAWLLNRLTASVDSLVRLGQTDQMDADNPPQARWIERHDKDTDFMCSVSSTSSARMLQAFLWSKCEAAVVTSATLTALGRFDRFCEQAGLDEGSAQQLGLPSPFDIPNRAALHIPAMRTLPTDATAHTEEIIEQCNAGLIGPHEGTLFLFASYRQMNAVADGLKPELSRLVLKQGDQPRAALVETHRQRIAGGGGSVIMGVASFSEGLDLPGDLCRHVIIAKVAFSVPTAPVDATYAEWLKENNRNPFFEVSLPDAGFRLTQAAGRLIRTELDTGIVTILDRRLVTKRYGQSLLKGLPPFQRQIAA